VPSPRSFPVRLAEPWRLRCWLAFSPAAMAHPPSRRISRPIRHLLHCLIAGVLRRTRGSPFPSVVEEATDSGHDQFRGVSSRRPCGHDLVLGPGADCLGRDLSAGPFPLRRGNSRSLYLYGGLDLAVLFHRHLAWLSPPFRFNLDCYRSARPLLPAIFRFRWPDEMVRNGADWEKRRQGFCCATIAKR
jgi:hypothetical protein